MNDNTQKQGRLKKLLARIPGGLGELLLEILEWIWIMAD